MSRQGMGHPVRARLIGEPEHIEAVEAAMRRVLDIPRASPPRPGRKGEHLSYLDITGVRSTDARPAPLELAEQAKDRARSRARSGADVLAAELDALMGADRELRSQPWFPIRPGDILTWWVGPPEVNVEHGETLLAVDEPPRRWTGAGAPLRLVSQSASAGYVNRELQDFYDIWFEAGPDRIAVIRAGRVVHGRVRRSQQPGRGGDE